MRLACVAVVVSAALVTSEASDLAVDVSKKRDAAAKRCQAAQRRIDRQQQVIAELDARIARDRQARERCERRACQRLDHSLKAGEARRVHYERQLEQYRRDAATLCTG